LALSGRKPNVFEELVFVGAIGWNKKILDSGSVMPDLIRYRNDGRLGVFGIGFGVVAGWWSDLDYWIPCW